jgi:pimeloyl-ACP methyl ester carboxylesterase
VIYDYDKEINDVKKEVKEKFIEYTMKTPYKEKYHKENENMIFKVFENKKALKGDIIFIHGIGPNNIKYLQWYAEYFSKKGYRTTMTILPYHYKRKSSDLMDGDPFYSSDPDKCIQLFHNAVKDIRKTIDYISKFDDFDKKNLHVMGVSFGGIIGTLLLALDKRINKGILTITGGNWRWINFYSPYTDRVREEYRTKGNAYGCNGEEFCAKNFRSDAQKFIKENFFSLDDIFEKSPIPCYAYDPLSFAPFVENKVLFIQGKYDKIIPKKASEELYEMFPNVKKKVFPAGHKSSILFKRIIARWAINFIEKSD